MHVFWCRQSEQEWCACRHLLEIFINSSVTLIFLLQICLSCSNSFSFQATKFRGSNLPNYRQITFILLSSPTHFNGEKWGMSSPLQLWVYRVRIHCFIKTFSSKITLSHLTVKVCHMSDWAVMFLIPPTNKPTTTCNTIETIGKYTINPLAIPGSSVGYSFFPIINKLELWIILIV